MLTSGDNLSMNNYTQGGINDVNTTTIITTTDDISSHSRIPFVTGVNSHNSTISETNTTTMTTAISVSAFDSIWPPQLKYSMGQEESIQIQVSSRQEEITTVHFYNQPILLYQYPPLPLLPLLTIILLKL
ncbi:unnamed protein product [Heterobilharzia americana]|nr:unnamed protein product [Heterobilharzia americana]